MRRIILHLTAALALGSSAFAQTATDPNEGCRLISLGLNDYQFTWWARADVYYLVDASDDLHSWNYVNTLFFGSGGISSPVNFNISGERFFVRLNTDPFHTDSDGDGIPDGWEVFYGLNARFAGDALLDPDGDGLSNLGEFLGGRVPNRKDHPDLKLSVSAYSTP